MDDLKMNCETSYDDSANLNTIQEDEIRSLKTTHSSFMNCLEGCRENLIPYR